MQQQYRHSRDYIPNLPQQSSCLMGSNDIFTSRTAEGQSLHQGMDRRTEDKISSCQDQVSSDSGEYAAFPGPGYPYYDSSRVLTGDIQTKNDAGISIEHEFDREEGLTLTNSIGRHVQHLRMNQRQARGMAPTSSQKFTSHTAVQPSQPDRNYISTTSLIKMSPEKDRISASWKKI